MIKKTQKRSAAPKFRSGDFYSRLGWITAGAALLRLLVAVELIRRVPGTIFAPPSVTDMATYIALGRDIASGNFTGGFYYQPLYYAGLLAPLFRLFPGNYGILAAVVVQWSISVVTVYLVGLIGRRIFGKRAGLIAATLAGLSAVLMLYIPFILNETLEAGLLVLSIYLALRYRRGGVGISGALGASAALLVLTRGNTLLLLVPILLYGGTEKIPIRRKLVKLAGALAIFWGVFLPFCIFNYSRQGVFFPSSAADAVLALGNTPEAPPGGRDPGLPAGPMEYPESYHIALERARAGESLPRQMWHWLVDEPGSFLELQFRKFLLFWDYREIPNNISMYGEGRESWILQLLAPGGINLLMPLALGGIFFFLPHLFRRRRADLGLLYAVTLVFAAAVSIFYILGRFRLPVLPLLAVFGGGLIAWIKWRNSASRSAAAAALLGGLWCSVFAFDFYRGGAEVAVIRTVRPQGVKVKSATEIIWFDHGPFSFGDWQEIPLKPGFALTKILSEAAPGAGVGEWSVFTAAPTTLTWQADSGKIRVTPLKLGVNRLTAPIMPGSESSAIKVLEVSGGAAAAAFDGRRCYDRSRLNGRLLPGEVVMRCRFPLVKSAH